MANLPTLEATKERMVRMNNRRVSGSDPDAAAATARELAQTTSDGSAARAESQSSSKGHTYVPRYVCMHVHCAPYKPPYRIAELGRSRYQSMGRWMVAPVTCVHL
ncbi:hypothetical protein PVAG01_03916 [Phlyctema vagabunda]|uniref:Uncharacterized protein n=1 Tax=Phlyctema vagabunda TaxID=108571 RepID=A0ABR4PMT0_9HELO